MKALNRAIARTVSQIARHAGEGCHVPMIMALENHLDALLTMERKMLDGVQDVVDRTGRVDGKSVADWMRELERVKAPTTGGLVNLRFNFYRVKEQRDQLLAALETLVEAHDTDCSDTDRRWALVDARLAIAAVKGNEDGRA